MSHRIAFVFAAASLVALLAVRGAGAEQPSWPLEVLENMDNQRIAVFPTLEEIRASPRWVPGEGPVPLGIDGAIESAALFESARAHATEVKVREVKLVPINDPRAADRWYYLARIDAVVDNAPATHFVGVLMNGVAVPGIADPDSVR